MPGNFKLSNWAAMIAVCGAYILWCGSIAGMFYSNKAPSIYGFVAGAIVLAFYWPLSILGGLLIVVKKNVANVIYLLALSIFCFFSQPTTMGGITFITSAIVFAIAIYTGEKESAIGGGGSCNILSQERLIFTHNRLTEALQFRRQLSVLHDGESSSYHSTEMKGYLMQDAELMKELRKLTRPQHEYQRKLRLQFLKK